MEEKNRNKMAEIPIKKLMLSMGIPMIISMVLLLHHGHFAYFNIHVTNH